MPVAAFLAPAPLTGPCTRGPPAAAPRRRPRAPRAAASGGSGGVSAAEDDPISNWISRATKGSGTGGGSRSGGGNGGGSGGVRGGRGSGTRGRGGVRRTRPAGNPFAGSSEGGPGGRYGRGAGAASAASEGGDASRKGRGASSARGGRYSGGGGHREGGGGGGAGEPAMKGSGEVKAEEAGRSVVDFVRGSRRRRGGGGGGGGSGSSGSSGSDAAGAFKAASADGTLKSGGNGRKGKVSNVMRGSRKKNLRTEDEVDDDTHAEDPSDIGENEARRRGEVRPATGVWSDKNLYEVNQEGFVLDVSSEPVGDDEALDDVAAEVDDGFYARYRERQLAESDFDTALSAGLSEHGEYGNLGDESSPGELDAAKDAGNGEGDDDMSKGFKAVDRVLDVVNGGTEDGDDTNGSAQRRFRPSESLTPDESPPPGLSAFGNGSSAGDGDTGSGPPAWNTEATQGAGNLDESKKDIFPNLFEVARRGGSTGRDDNAKREAVSGDGKSKFPTSAPRSGAIPRRVRRDDLGEFANLPRGRELLEGLSCEADGQNFGDEDDLDFGDELDLGAGGRRLDKGRGGRQTAPRGNVDQKRSGASQSGGSSRRRSGASRASQDVGNEDDAGVRNLMFALEDEDEAGEEGSVASYSKGRAGDQRGLTSRKIRGQRRHEATPRSSRARKRPVVDRDRLAGLEDDIFFRKQDASPLFNRHAGEGSLTSISDCVACSGSGMQDCKVCEGDGWVRRPPSSLESYNALPYRVRAVWELPDLVVASDGRAQCPDCNGYGKAFCDACEGSGSRKTKGFNREAEREKVFNLAVDETIDYEGAFTEYVDDEDDEEFFASSGASQGAGADHVGRGYGAGADEDDNDDDDDDDDLNDDLEDDLDDAEFGEDWMLYEGEGDLESLGLGRYDDDDDDEEDDDDDDEDDDDDLDEDDGGVVGAEDVADDLELEEVGVGDEEIDVVGGLGEDLDEEFENARGIGRGMRYVDD